jgi:putative membrane protein
MNRLLATAALAAMTLTLAASSQSQTNSVSGHDSDFVMKVYEANLAEIDQGRMAVDKGTFENLRSYGQRMIDDHMAANDDLKALAAKKAITLPTSVDEGDQAFATRLSNRSGIYFNDMYVGQAIRDHSKDIALFRSEIDHGSDPDVVQWARDMMPTIQRHWELARSLGEDIVWRRHSGIVPLRYGMPWLNNFDDGTHGFSNDFVTIWPV